MKEKPFILKDHGRDFVIHTKETGKAKIDIPEQVSSSSHIYSEQEILLLYDNEGINGILNLLDKDIMVMEYCEKSIKENLELILYETQW